MARLKTENLLLASLLVLSLIIYVMFAKDQVFLAQNYKRNLSHPDVVLPAPASILLSAGDSHLAGNLLFIRVLVASTQEMSLETRKGVMQLQQQVSVMLPAHEDNYYVAEATLPWMGFVDETNQILLTAAKARKADPYPYFYAGFNLQQFKGDYLGAARLVEKAAEAAPQFKVALQVIASKWYARIPTPEIAEKALDTLMAQTSDPEFKAYLGKQKLRNRVLVHLTGLVGEFHKKMQRVPRDWGELVQAGMLEKEPVDPLGGRFVVDDHGSVRLMNH